MNASTNPERSTATAEANEYEVRILMDGDEVDLPFRIKAGRDYGNGERLTAIAKGIAFKVMNQGSSYPVADTVEVLIREVPGTDCTGDSEPVDLAAATEYVW